MYRIYKIYSQNMIHPVILSKINIKSGIGL